MAATTAAAVDFSKIFKEAEGAGLAAASREREGFLDCGFAWVWLPGNSPAGRWAKKNLGARPGYPKGLEISCRLCTQSVTIKGAWARAYAQVLQRNGITAHAQERLD